jgi:hypothetical protein
VDGHERAFFLASRQNGPEFQVEVLLDLTHEQADVQLEILERIGQYWSPQNLSAAYRKNRLADLKPSAWIDHFWQQPKSRQEDPALEPHLAEVSFARQTYERLSREHGAMVDSVLTAKDIEALERNRKLR